MAAPRVQLHAGALDRVLADNAVVLLRYGREVRDRARENARALGLAGHRTQDPENAIIAVPGRDAEGPYVDVGYDKTHPGFYLWWWEVGTKYNPARPHLRPAVRPNP